MPVALVVLVLVAAGVVGRPLATMVGLWVVRAGAVVIPIRDLPVPVAMGASLSRAIWAVGLPPAVPGAWVAVTLRAVVVAEVLAVGRRPPVPQAMRLVVRVGRAVPVLAVAVMVVRAARLLVLAV